MNNDEILVELRKIGNYLGLLSIEPMKKLLEVLKEKKVFTSKQRIEMFLLINGERTTPEIAEKVGIGQRGAQHFIKELEDIGLIRTERKGNALVPTLEYEKLLSISLME